MPLRIATLAWIIVGTLSAQSFQPRLFGEPRQGQSPTREAEQSFNLAVKLEQAGNREQARAIYERLVAEFPGNRRYYQRLKRLLRSSAQYRDLLQVVDAHLRRYPDDIQSRVELGDAQLALGDKAQALRTWEGLLQRFPESAMAERLVLTHLLTNNLTGEGVALLERLRLEKGDPSYFALDLGRLYAARLAYDLATKEFLRYLSGQPQAVANVMHQLLRFPTEPEVVEMLREQLLGHGTPAALRILAGLEFKHRQFARVVELHRQLGSPPGERLNLALDLVAEEEWNLAQALLEELLADPEAVAFYEESVLGLAGIHQARSQSHQLKLPLSGFYAGNRFFTLPYIGVTESQLGSLRRAINLYDSLATTWQNPLALLRLGDIKFLILDDFDGAITGYESILFDRNAGRYHAEALLRLIDVWIAKGDLGAAEEVRRRAGTRLKTREHANLREVKALELVFLSGDQDSLLAYLGGQLAVLGPGDPYFNDLLELSGLVRRFEGSPVAYRAFVQSEALLRQNRRSEAIAMLSANLDVELSPATAPVLQYRLAELQARHGNHAEAEMLGLGLPKDSEFGELGLLLAAEVSDYLSGDSERAAGHYLTFLDTYPLSIHADAARLRYRTLHPDAD